MKIQASNLKLQETFAGNRILVAASVSEWILRACDPRVHSKVAPALDSNWSLKIEAYLKFGFWSLKLPA